MLSSYIWLQFSMPITIEMVSVNFLMVIGSYPFIRKYKIGKDFRRLLLIAIIMMIWNFLNYEPLDALNRTLTITPVLILFILPQKRKENTLDFVTKWLALILGIGFIIFLLTRIFDIPPILGTFDAEGMNYALFKNHLFFLESTGQGGSAIWYRFNGIFLEPGHLSMISCLMIFANDYNFKKNKYLWIYLFCIVLSFSLAGYLIFAIGYFGLKFNKTKYLLGGALFLLFSYIVFGFVINNGDNAVNNLIFSRLQYDEEKGIVGNNRSWEVTDDLFEEIISTDQFWKGVDMEEYGNRIGGAGYKIYILRYGLISTLLVFSLYLFLIPSYSDKRYSYVFLVIIILLFIQRAYPTWYSWLLPFTLGCGIRKQELKLLYK